jgi:N-acetylneuraminic acid mutarotase
MSTRRDNAGVAAADGKLYVFGGRTRNASGSVSDPTLATVEIYDPATGTWSAGAAMPTGRRTMVVSTLRNRIQVMGGELAGDGSAFDVNEEYDPATDTWTTLQPLPTPRHGAARGTVNGTVYVIGGGPTGGSAFTNANEAFSFRP